MKNIGIYIHIPFCKHKCYYCDFKSYENKVEKIDEYIKWLIYEIQEVAELNKLDYREKRDDLICIDTIYIGGGTPSYIDSKYIIQIMETIKQSYVINKNAEITIEVNPGTVDKKKLEDYNNIGINRLSIGLQTTNNTLLNKIGRIHTYEQFLYTYKIAHEVGFDNINVDLIIAIPEQTQEDVKKDVDNIIKLEPTHISVYSLILEEDTKLKKDVEDKKLVLPSEDEERKMYWEVKEILEKNNYIQYEISNFCKNGYESKHNLDCWNQKEYIGFGVAAHSYTNNIRYSNTDSIEDYIRNYKIRKPEDNLILHEKQNKLDKMMEYMILGLRKIQGVNIQSFKQKFKENPVYIFNDKLKKLSDMNLIQIDSNNIFLTSKGLDFANIVWEEFV